MPTAASPIAADATEVAPASTDAGADPQPGATSPNAASTPQLEQLATAASAGSAQAAPAPISPVSAAAVSGAGATPAASQQIHVATVGSTQDAPAPRAAATPAAETSGQSSQSDQPREDNGRAPAAVIATPKHAVTNATATTVGHAANPKVDPAAASTVTQAPDAKVDHASATGGAADGADMPIAQADLTQPHADRGASGVSTPAVAVPLHKSVEALNATVTTMTTKGLTQARINLTPASLGGVKVILTQTDNGLVARVVADHPEAAQALAASAGELRRTLEAAGTTVVSVDVGTADGQGAGDAQGGHQNGTSPYTSQSHANPGAAVSDLGDGGDETTQTRQLTVALGDGSLVNVLA